MLGFRVQGFRVKGDRVVAFGAAGFGSYLCEVCGSGLRHNSRLDKGHRISSNCLGFRVQG